jgi:hypothetical protein
MKYKKVMRGQARQITTALSPVFPMIGKELVMTKGSTAKYTTQTTRTAKP